MVASATSFWVISPLRKRIQVRRPAIGRAKVASGPAQAQHSPTSHVGTGRAVYSAAMSGLARPGLTYWATYG
ncbi:hypothetical protein E2562_010273 [Oryza meyeriana var. granulata]|uniref:Uncharacterized protein n=1 Tax=Oryza meyeriana var. granulata TaxID=110450 RepID=A0A6G1EJ35_9ORYZ|nr:hypothetical protein E2562_010273 [Oryza meyeriana var. granulata]